MPVRDWIDPSRLYNPGKPAGRLMYLWGGAAYPMLAFIVAGFCAATVDGSSGVYDESPVLDLVGTPLTLAFYLGIILITIRRLKDLAKSGWYILLGLVPLVNLVFGLWLLLAPGTGSQAVTVASPMFGFSAPPPSATPLSSTGPSRTPRAPTSPLYCPSCGAVTIPDAQYCMNCGARLPSPRLLG